MIKIRRTGGGDDQVFKAGNKIWFVDRLISKSKNLEVKEMDITAMNMWGLNPVKNDSEIQSFVDHCKRTNDADLNCPLILDEDGYLMDGRHRLAKALLTGQDKLKYVRFEETPSPDYYKD